MNRPRSPRASHAGADLRRCRAARARGSRERVPEEPVERTHTRVPLRQTCPLDPCASAEPTRWYWTGRDKHGNLKRREAWSLQPGGGPPTGASWRHDRLAPASERVRVRARTPDPSTRPPGATQHPIGHPEGASSMSSDPGYRTRQWKPLHRWDGRGWAGARVVTATCRRLGLPDDAVSP